MNDMRQRKMLQQIRMRWQLFLFILPAFLYLCMFDYKPMYGIAIAFQDYKLMDGIAGSQYVGLENFMRLFSSYWFPILLKNTISISVLTLALSFPLPVIMALMVNEVRTPWLKKGFQTISYAPHFISIVVVCSMVTLFLSPSNGVINRLIELLGGEAVPFMQNPKYVQMDLLSSAAIWQNTGWDAIIYFARAFQRGSPIAGGGGYGRREPHPENCACKPSRSGSHHCDPVHSGLRFPCST